MTYQDPNLGQNKTVKLVNQVVNQLSRIVFHIFHSKMFCLSLVKNTTTQLDSSSEVRFTQTNANDSVDQLQISFGDDDNHDADANDGIQQYATSNLQLLTDQTENVVLERKVCWK